MEGDGSTATAKQSCVLREIPRPRVRNLYSWAKVDYCGAKHATMTENFEPVKKLVPLKIFMGLEDVVPKVGWHKHVSGRSPTWVCMSLLSEGLDLRKGICLSLALSDFESTKTELYDRGR